MSQESSAIIYTILAQALNTVNAAIFKRAKVSIDQMIYQRSIIVVTGIYFKNQEAEYYPKRTFSFVFLQGLIMALSAPLYFLSMRAISMSEGQVISYMNTIWSQVLSYYFLGELITSKRIRNIIISFVGLLLITRPAFLFGSLEDDDQTHFFGCLTGLSASLMQAVSLMYVRMISENISSPIKTFYFHVPLMFVGAMGLIIQEEQIYYSWIIFMQALGCAASTYLSNICLMEALKRVSYSKLAPYAYSGILFSLFSDYFLFSKLPEFISVIGGSIIIVSMILSIKNI